MSEYQKPDPITSLNTIVVEIGSLQDTVNKMKTQFANDMEFLIKEFERFNYELKTYQETFLEQLAKSSQSQIEQTVQELKKAINEIKEEQNKKQSIFSRIMKKGENHEKI